MTQTHTVDDCPQNPIINDMKQLLGRVAVALEDIARQGAMVTSHEKRLDLHDKNINELYELQRGLTTALATINVRHAVEDGAGEVEEKIEADKLVEHKFWNDVKAQLAPYVAWITFAAYLIADKWDLSVKLAKIWKEIKP